jgi:hypothetical protein
MNANTLPAEARETWSVTVLYEDTQVRERAMRMCDHLMRQFWSELEFDFDWWRVSFLEDAILARQAESHVSDADLLIVAVHGESDLSVTLKRCLEAGLDERGVRQGAFIALFDDEQKRTPAVLRNGFYLRTLAHRYGMDYLTEAPTALAGALPDSLDGFSERAEEHSSVMEDILRQTPRSELRL